MKQLQISKDISIPLEVVTQTIAIMAKRRAGKSYTMRKLVEELLANNQQVILVDPKGDQWGIRSSADGKKPGYPIVILGGEHGDAPLEVNAGEIVAKLAVEERVSMLLDLSSFRKHEIATFMAIFLENLYRLKAQEKYRTPVMLVIDEADAIAPQKPQKGEERMLGAADDIVRRGGQRGIGCALITQRSAVLNKNVLTQAQMLVVLRTIAPQDLAAMKAWIEVHGDLEQGKDLMNSLPSLPIGEAWFWSPGWPTAEGIFARSKVLPIKTFDSGATPEPGHKQIIPKNLTDINIDVLKKQMAETIEKAKNEDPKTLKKRIVQLETELKNTNSGKVIQKVVESDPKVVEKAVIQAVQKRDKQWQAYVSDLERSITKIATVITSVELNMVAPKPFKISQNKVFKIPGIVKTQPKTTVLSDDDSIEISNTRDLNATLSKSARSILDYLSHVFPEEKTKAQLWIATGYSPGGGFNNLIYELTGQGHIVKTTKGYKAVSGANIDYDKSLDKWLAKVSSGARKILSLLMEDAETPIGKEEIAERTGYALGGGFNNLIYELTGPEIVKKVDGGYVINPIALDL